MPPSLRPQRFGQNVLVDFGLTWLHLQRRTGRCVQERVGRFKEQFSGTRELDGLTSAAAGLATPIFYAVSAAAAAGAALGGYAAASQAPLEGMGFLHVSLTVRCRSTASHLNCALCTRIST